tara:strand:+ start:74 stop:658 length:585 start_codon:yes stop_codon:yes gene_type:complete
MEKNKLSDYISVYDDVFGNKKNNILYKLVSNNYFPFRESEVFTNDHKQITNKEIRSTEVFSLGNINTNNNTIIHWTNLFSACFTHYAEKYSKKNKVFSTCKIIDLQILKYELGGFYKKHIDSGLSSPRTLSFIYFINDNYKNGELIFELPQNNETIKIDVKKDRLIIWPSNFLYPHKVEPVTEGVKFSVVSWGL